MVSLDGSTSYIGHEFVKLLHTGSSHLATEAFVNEAVAEGGGGGGADLTDYYDKGEVDNLLNAKLNINNPQDMAGTLRIGHLAGTSKIILNAVSSAKDFYVSGDAEINGSFLATSIDSNSFIQGANVIASSDVKTNVIDSNGISDITLKRNTFDICYLKNSSLELNAGINLVAPAQVQANTYNSFDDSSILFLRSDEEFMRFRKTEDDILVAKDIVAPNIVLSGEVKTDALNSNSVSDITFKRNNVNIASLTATDFKTETGIDIISNGEVKCNKFESVGNNNVDFYRNGNRIFSLQQTVSGYAYPAIVQPTDYVFITDKIFCDELRNRYNNNFFLFWGGNIANNGRINYLTYRPASEDVLFYTDVNINSGVKLITDTVSSPDATNLTIERGGSPFITLTSSKVQLASGITLDGDVIAADAIHGDDCFANRFRVRHTTQDTAFDGANTTEDGRFTFMVYRHINENLRILRSVLIDTGYKIHSDVYGSSSNADVYIKRNGITYIQLGGTHLRTRLETGCQSDIYDSLGNSDATFRRNGIDFFYLRNGKVETNTNIDLSTDVVSSKGDNDIAFERNSFEYFKLTVVNTEPFVMLGDTVNISAKECYANEFSNRSFNQDTLFYGGNTTDNGRVKYMEYKHHEEELNIVSNATIETGKTLTGELVDTSDLIKKYEIKEVETNMTDIVKSIKPKTFKMIDEKEKGINRNHIGFIADDLESIIPDEWENITNNRKGVKQLNYIKMNATLWGVCREQQNKIEHLEASVYELQEALKDYIKPKPKTKPKSKPKTKDTLVEF